MLTPGQDTGKRTGSRWWLPTLAAVDPPVNTAHKIMVRPVSASIRCGATLGPCIALTQGTALTKQQWCMLRDHSKMGDTTQKNSTVDVPKNLQQCGCAKKSLTIGQFKADRTVSMSCTSIGSAEVTPSSCSLLSSETEDRLLDRACAMGAGRSK